MKIRVLIFSITLVLLISFLTINIVSPVLAGQNKKYKIVMQSSYGPTSADSRSMLLLKEMWDEAMPGVFEWEMHHSSALFGHKDALPALARGSLTLLYPSHFNFRTIEPLYGIFDLPFLIDDFTHNFAFMDSPVMEKMRKSLEKKGVYVLQEMVPTAPVEFEKSAPGTFAIYSKKPIRKLEDLKGMRIRTLTAPAQVKMGKALGFMPQAIAFSEVAMALRTGMVDGIITVPDKALLTAFGVFENLEYCLWNVATMQGEAAYVVNAAWWNKLPAEIKAKIAEVMPKYMERRTQEISLPVLVEAGELIREKLEVTNLNPEEYDRWKAKVNGIWDEWARDVKGGKEAIDTINALRPSKK